MNSRDYTRNPQQRGNPYIYICGFFTCVAADSVLQESGVVRAAAAQRAVVAVRDRHLDALTRQVAAAFRVLAAALAGAHEREAGAGGLGLARRLALQLRPVLQLPKVCRGVGLRRRCRGCASAERVGVEGDRGVLQAQIT